MAPFRASRSTRSDRRTGTQADADVFDGLPVRQWRLHESIVAPPSVDQLQPGFGANNPPEHGGHAAQQLQRAKQYNKWTVELPMPKGSELYAPWCQQLLRAARAGRIRKRTDEDGGQQQRDDEKEDDSDNVQQTELKGFMAKRWTQIPRPAELPEPEYLAKRRKGLTSVIPIGHIPGMVGVDGQGAAAEGGMGPPVVEERRRNMPPRRKPKKGPKKKKMIDGAGMGVSASAEALAASHANGAAAGANDSNTAAAPKTEGESDSPMQDADEGDEDGEDGESGDDDGEDDAEMEESEVTDATPPTNTGPDAAATTARPQHPLATEISATEIMSEPTADEPLLPPVLVESLPSEVNPPNVEHDLVPEATDEPLADAPSVAASKEDTKLEPIDIPAPGEQPISAAAILPAIVPEPKTEDSAVPEHTEQVEPQSTVEEQAKIEDEAIKRDIGGEGVPQLETVELPQDPVEMPAEPIANEPPAQPILQPLEPAIEPTVEPDTGNPPESGAHQLLNEPAVAAEEPAVVAAQVADTAAAIDDMEVLPPPVEPIDSPEPFEPPAPIEPHVEAVGAMEAVEEAKMAVTAEEDKKESEAGTTATT